MPISETAYVRIVNLLGPGDCLACEENISPLLLEPCFQLTRVDQCTWEGQALQDAECFPDSLVRLTLNCDDNNVTITFTWVLSDTDTGIWQRTYPMSHLDCQTCQTHILDPVDHAAACNTQFSWIEVNFGRFGRCCEFCPDQYKIEIAGVAENDPQEFCTDADCEQLNGTYLVDFIQKGVSPTGACTDGMSDWCEYRTDLELRCTDSRFGFCSLHLYIKNSETCGTRLRVEIVPDDRDDIDCDAIAVGDRQGWAAELAVDCSEIDVTMDLTNVCRDTNWNCLPDTVTIRVSLPDADVQPSTRLTGMGLPGARFF